MECAILRIPDCGFAVKCTEILVRKVPKGLGGVCTVLQVLQHDDVCKLDFGVQVGGVPHQDGSRSKRKRHCPLVEGGFCQWKAWKHASSIAPCLIFLHGLLVSTQDATYEVKVASKVDRKGSPRETQRVAV
eukprot:5502893-Amphidinium_carterae.1